MTSGDSEWEGAVHTLIVYRALPPDGKWDDWHLDYDIVHPDSCGPIMCWRDGTHDYLDRARTCFIDYCIDGAGLAWSLAYSHTPVTRPGTYLIRGWGTKIYYYDMGYEYDSSIRVVGPGTIQKLLPSPTQKLLPGPVANKAAMIYNQICSRQQWYRPARPPAYGAVTTRLPT